MYGTRSQAAGLETFAKAIMVARMANHKNTISTKAKPGECNPKNIIDHKTFKASCPINMLKAAFTFFLFNPFCQTINSAMPISKNRAVQAGPNTQFGGASWGFSRLAYQPSIDGIVNTEPITAASWGIKIAMTNFKILFMIIFSYILYI